METISVLVEEYAAHFSDLHEASGQGDVERQLARGIYAEVKQGSSFTQGHQVVVGRKGVHVEREG